MTDPVQKTRNMYEIRQDRLITGWTVEFDRIKKRDNIFLALIFTLLGLNILQVFLWSI